MTNSTQEEYLEPKHLLQIICKGILVLGASRWEKKTKIRCKDLLKQANVVSLTTIEKYILNQKFKKFHQFTIARSEKLCLGQNSSFPVFFDFLPFPIRSRWRWRVSDRLHTCIYHIFVMM